MPHPDCVAEISRALGREVSPEEAAKYETDLQRHGRVLAQADPKAWRQLSHVQRVMRAAESAKAERLGKADKLAQRHAAHLVAQTREVGHLRTRAPALRGPHKHHAALFERLRQADNYIAGVRAESLAAVFDTIQALEPRFLKLIDNPIAVRDFAREVFGQETGNPVVAKAAKGYLEAMEQLRLRMNAAGADVGKLSHGWHAPQLHDIGKIARTDKRAWVQAVEPLVNRNRYFNDDGTAMTDAEFQRKLEAVYDALSTEGRNEMVPTGRVREGALAARKDDQHRQLHFKSADSYLRYMARFGRGSMLEGIVGHVNATARTIGLLESFGPAPNATFRLLREHAEKLDNKRGAREALANLDQVWDTLTASASQPVDATLAALFQDVRNYVVAAKLQGVMLSSVTDAPLLLLAAKTNGMPLGATIKNALQAFGHDSGDAATRLGLATESITSEMAQWHQDNLAQGWSHHLASTTMRLTLVEAWTHALRRGFSLTLSSTLAKMRAADWNALGDFDRGRFTAAGVTEADWRIWQRAELAEVGGSPILTKDGIRAVAGESPEALNQATARFLGLLDQEAKMAVLAPDLMTRAAITQGYRTGTWGGELLRSLMLFKSFPVAMMVQHLRRIRTLPNNTARVAYSATMMTSLTLFGALALQLKAMASGADPRDMSDQKFWGAAFVQGGGVGVFGDVIYAGMQGLSRGGQRNWTTLAGPVFGTVLEGAATGFDVGAALSGQDTKAGAQVLRFVKGNTPLINLWYARAMVDHLFLHDLQESVSPGYLRKTRRRARREWGQEFWWEPGEALPDRAPNLEAAVGE